MSVTKTKQILTSRDKLLAGTRISRVASIAVAADTWI